jgi:hypothetical protein
MSNNQTNSKEDRSSELSALKIACTIGSNSFVLSELKKHKRKMIMNVMKHVMLLLRDAKFFHNLKSLK